MDYKNKRLQKLYNVIGVALGLAIVIVVATFLTGSFTKERLLLLSIICIIPVITLVLLRIVDLF